MSGHDRTKPISVLIAALGGEGGGVLSGWLAAAASAEGFPVQSTSIPGVAQRTGATTYYLEIFPGSWTQLGDAAPVLALSPTPGNLDMMVATEFLEAARAVENGWVTPENTRLVASTHRAYSIIERSAMADGRYDDSRILNAIRERSQSAVMFDMERAAREARSMLSPVVFGAIARAGNLPIKKETFQAAIEASGIAVETNLRGFEAGFEHAGATAQPSLPGQQPVKASPGSSEELLTYAEREYAEPVKTVAINGVRRLLDFQGRAYARLYLDRLNTIVAVDQAAHGWTLATEVARLLALRMSYEDIIRVADLKTRAERAARVREEVKAKPDEPVRTTEFLKPGLDEVTAVLPRFIGRPLMNFATKRGWQDKLNVGLHLRTNTVLGFTLLWGTGRLRALRPLTWRYAQEQQQIDDWLETTRQAARLNYDFAVEVSRCAHLIKGYGSTHRRGTANYNRIFEEAVAPAIRTGSVSANNIARLRQAALSDPEGRSLDNAFNEIRNTVTS
jgi:indolepyruvate ferredoxin oxidoreductase beta subunit